MEKHPGTYALELASTVRHAVKIGKLGQLLLRPGYYVYLGSAFGSGGLKARIAHHRNGSSRPHWHIDYLRGVLQLQEIWYTHDSERREHLWSDILAGLKGASAPIPGFGASDCRCISHLQYFKSRPSVNYFRTRVYKKIKDHDKIFIEKPLDGDGI